ncbi:acetyl esterase [Streptomyces sp. SAI-135]|jgi:acetyl esterase/lipase|nr:acetyl esterase [Streptomyces sp. SAI-090]MDH6614451.1 acetyl esterase [Streptomyces sp. SAI-135]
MSSYTTSHGLLLEPVVEAFLHASSPVERDAPGGRRALERAQSGRALLPETDAEWVTVPGGPTGGVPVRIVRPRGTTAVLPVVLCLHGPGWVFSSAVTHDRLVRELAVGADAAVVFPEYTRPPEAAYPVALQQIHTVARRPAGENGPGGLDGTRMAVAGDSAGGTLAAALTLPAKEHGDVRFAHQVLFCPVTDAGCDSASYERFASGYRRAHARQRDQLAGLPPGLVITAEADVVRDEGEAYAAGLRAAGVPVTAVRHLGVVHGFVLLDALRGSQAAASAIALACDTLHSALHDALPKACPRWTPAQAQRAWPRRSTPRRRSRTCTPRPSPWHSSTGCVRRVGSVRSSP